MIITRGQNFRAVDSNDQMRLGSCKFRHITRTKAWPVVFWGIVELLLVNMWLICRLTPEMKDVLQRDFRWRVICELVEYAEYLERQGSNEAEPTDRTDDAEPGVVPRFHDDAADLHHWDTLTEYVSEERAVELHELHSADPKPLPAKKTTGSR